MLEKRAPRALVTGAALGLVLGLTGAASATECGTDKKIDIAEMNWATAAALAHIHAHILGDGYGCNTEVVQGDTVPTSASMFSRSKPAIAPELWTSSIEEKLKVAVDDGKVFVAGDTFKGGGLEAWFIPQYVKDEHPELVTADDVIAHPELFPSPDDPSKGRLYGCIPGWACEIANASLFEAYDMEDKDWELFSPGSGGNLAASIARAYTRNEPIFYYYWGPTTILGKYEAYQVEMPPVDEKGYACNTNPECTDPPVKTSWPSSPIKVVAANWLKSDAPAVADYLDGITMDRDAISKLIAWGDDNKADAEATAVYFLKEKKDIWSKWVPDDVAEKVSAAVADM